ncbi:MAG: GDP-L-fucose synthase [Deltaproteobacteria bacterium]|nr:GDP-L-fucose synthase [Deltaproteobacteria bacterium]
MEKDSRIFVAGHRGLAGSAICRTLESKGYKNLILRPHKELDLTNQADVERFFYENRPEYVFLAAAKVGGIMANYTYPADFIYQNLAIEINVIHFSYKYGVKKLLFLGSSCIYPRLAPQPLKEEYLLSGYLEPTNQAYAIAKIAGIMMCNSYNYQYKTNFLSVMPTNLYGPNDNFDLETSHVIPALIRKFVEAKERQDNKVTVWGTGNVRREFLHSDDFADACIFLMENYDAKDVEPFINIGSGVDITIKELAYLIADIVGFSGSIEFDTSKPDGTPQKLLDVSRINRLGWRYKISLEEGLRDTIKWFITHKNRL